jgi:hypothetical protein
MANHKVVPNNDVTLRIHHHKDWDLVIDLSHYRATEMRHHNPHFSNILHEKSSNSNIHGGNIHTQTISKVNSSIICNP